MIKFERPNGSDRVSSHLNIETHADDWKDDHSEGEECLLYADKHGLREMNNHAENLGGDGCFLHVGEHDLSGMSEHADLDEKKRIYRRANGFP